MIWPPPQDSDVLERYASALGIKMDTDAWCRFSDLAAVDRGIIRRDLLSDKEVIEMLPIFSAHCEGNVQSRKNLVD